MPAPKPGVKAQLLGQRVGNACAATAQDHLVTDALGLGQLDELRHVLDVDILLGDGLRDQGHISVKLLTLLEELLVGDLRAEVISLDHLVPLQAVMAGKALPVHDGVDAHGMGIGAR